MEEEWLEQAMEAHETALIRLCFAYLGDRALAEDAVQETFLKAWRAHSRFRGEAGDGTWLFRIAVNTCKDMRRKAWFRRVERAVLPEDLPEASAEATAEDDSVTREVMRLPVRLREAALLRWQQGLTGEEVARALGVSRSTLYARLEKAKKILQKGLGEARRCDR